jgi:hypothetical protein
MDSIPTDANARNGDELMKRTLPLLLIFTAALLADGGAVQSRQEAGPFIITVFASPAPLRAGPVDLSVLVQDRETQHVILDAAVSIHLQNANSEINATAASANAQNKLLYAANVDLKIPGDWQYSVTITRASASATVSGKMTASPAGTSLSSYWSYFAFPPVCIVLFGIHQWLRGSSGRRLPPAKS